MVPLGPALHQPLHMKTNAWSNLSFSTLQRQKQHLLLNEPFFLQCGIQKNGSFKEPMTVFFRDMCAEHFVQGAQKGENPGLKMGHGVGNKWSHKCFVVTAVAHSDHKPHTYTGWVPSSRIHQTLIRNQQETERKETKALGTTADVMSWNLKISFRRIVLPYIQSQFILPLGKNDHTKILLHKASEVVLSQMRKTIMLLLSSWDVRILWIMYIVLLYEAQSRAIIHVQQLCKTFCIHFSPLTLLISSFYDPLFSIF